MNIQALLSEKVSQALIAAGAPADCEPQVRQSAKVQFGDYQANGVMAVAKKLGMAPRQLAEQVLSHLDLNGIANKVEIAGPGFINIFLDPAFLADNVNRALQSERLGVTKPQAQTIVVDYSAPNVAKEMHVGHLRSTIIGDASVRTLEFLGHKVIRANHVGDWGTQFGMLIAYLEKQQQENAGEMALADLEGFYREAKKHYDEDEAFAERARSYVVKLQGGDEYFLQMWRKLVDITMSQNQITYDRLNVTLTRDDVMGESLYNRCCRGSSRSDTPLGWRSSPSPSARASRPLPPDGHGGLRTSLSTASPLAFRSATIPGSIGLYRLSPITSSRVRVTFRRS